MENFSTSSDIFDLRLSPAVSVSLISLPLNFIVSEIASRVVPGTLETIDLSSLKRALKKVDFPAFGLPRIPTVSYTHLRAHET